MGGIKKKKKKKKKVSEESDMKRLNTNQANTEHPWTSETNQ